MGQPFAAAGNQQFESWHLKITLNGEPFIGSKDHVPGSRFWIWDFALWASTPQAGFVGSKTLRF
jgi:hypothetical protein